MLFLQSVVLGMILAQAPMDQRSPFGTNAPNANDGTPDIAPPRNPAGTAAPPADPSSTKVPPAPARSDAGPPPPTGGGTSATPGTTPAPSSAATPSPTINTDVPTGSPNNSSATAASTTARMSGVADVPGGVAPASGTPRQPDQPSVGTSLNGTPDGSGTFPGVKSSSTFPGVSSGASNTR